MYDPQSPLQNACVQAQSLLVDMMPESFQADSTPDADNLAFLERHLLDCPACQAYQEDMVMLTASLADLEEVPVPVGLADRIMQKIGQEATTQALGDDDTASPAPFEPVLARQSQSVRATSKVVSFRWGKLVPIAAAVLLLALVVPAVLKTTPQHTSAPEVAVKPATRQAAPVVAHQAEVVEPLVSSSEEQIASVVSSETIARPMAPRPAAIAAETASNMDAAWEKDAAQPKVAHAPAKTSRSASSLAELDTADLVASVPDVIGEGGELYEEDPVSSLVGY